MQRNIKNRRHAFGHIALSLSTSWRHPKPFYFSFA